MVTNSLEAMMIMNASRRRAQDRDMLYFTTPSLWPMYPFLPVTRIVTNESSPQLGLLFDAQGVAGLSSYRCTVFLCNLLFVPDSCAEFLAFPKCVYDSLDELADDGWVVD